MAAIKIKWNKMGEEFTYNIWYSKTEVGPWVKHNNILLTESSLLYRLYGERSIEAQYLYNEENTYILNGLDDNTEYYVKVTCSDRYNKWWYSYSGVTSIDGGLFDLSSRPSPEWNNTLSFQIEVTGV